MRTLSRVLVLVALCLAAIAMMGAGNDCPKACIVEGSQCALTCNGPLEGVCTSAGSVLYCQDIDPG